MTYMRWSTKKLLFVPILFAAYLPISAAAPDTILTCGERLEKANRIFHWGEEPTMIAVGRLKDDADIALERGPYSVTDKDEVPPSGDKRDYMSQGPFWWPNPDTEDGLPYIRRDGERNPEADELDRRPMGRMASAVSDLGFAYFYTGREFYAEHAALLLRTWFLDEETGMNPHLRFGQRIPGRTDGRGIGIIDTVSLLRMIDSVILLEASDAWTDEDHAALKDWFREYTRWLLESDLGQDEREHYNNHGTWYDVQVATFALFTGDDDTARKILAESGDKRIATQVDAEGRQEYELARTLPFHYSVYNLDALLHLARLGEQADVDIWGYESEDGASIAKAVDYLIPYVTGEAEWEYEGIRDPDWARFYPLLRRAALISGDDKYEDLYQELTEDDERLRSNVKQRYPNP